MSVSELSNPLIMHLVRGFTFLFAVFAIFWILKSRRNQGGSLLGDNSWRIVVVLLGLLTVVQLCPGLWKVDLSKAKSTTSIPVTPLTEPVEESFDAVVATMPAKAMSAPVHYGEGDIAPASKGPDEWEAPTVGGGPSIAEVPNGAAAGTAAGGSVWMLLAFAGIWLSGALMVMLRWAVARWKLSVLLGESKVVDDPDLLEQLGQAKVDLGIRRRVRLRQHPSISVPMTWGILSPVVLMPAVSRTWSPEERRMALLHELGHVRACDGLYLLLTRVLTALHWMNPFVWVAGRRLSMLQEEGADRAVLEAGGSATVYANLLLRLAGEQRSVRGRGSAALGAISMARPSSVPSRIESILDGSGRRKLNGVRAVARLVLLLVLGGMAAGLAVTTVSGTADEEEPNVTDDPGSHPTASEPIHDDVIPGHPSATVPKPAAPALSVPVDSIPVPDERNREPDEAYLSGFMFLNKGTEALEDGEIQRALQFFEQAKERFDLVDSQWPDWNAEMVDYRRDKLVSVIAETRSKLKGASRHPDSNLVVPTPAGSFRPVEPSVIPGPPAKLDPDSGFGIPGSGPIEAVGPGGSGELMPAEPPVSILPGAPGASPALPPGTASEPLAEVNPIPLEPHVSGFGAPESQPAGSLMPVEPSAERPSDPAPSFVPGGNSSEQTVPVQPVPGSFHFGPNHPKSKQQSGSIIPAMVEGQVKALRVGERQKVEAGELVLELDDTEHRLLLEKAEADLARARAQVSRAQAGMALEKLKLERFKSLIKSQAVSPTEVQQREMNLTMVQAELESYEAELQLAEAELKLRKLAVDRCKLRAPRSGTILLLDVKVGASVTKGQPIFRLLEE